MFPWTKQIPLEIFDDIGIITDFTRRNTREAAITFCKRRGVDKLFVANSAEGKLGSVDVKGCDVKYGNVEKVGDIHTHPWTHDTIGTAPSEADLTGTMEDSAYHKNRQIGCTVNHGVPYIHCWTPKEIPDRKTANAYARALDKMPKNWRKKGIPAFFLDHVGKDFDYAFFDRQTGRRVNKPEPKKILVGAIGRAGRHTRRRIAEMDRGPFCNYLNDLTVPEDDRIGQECRHELRTRKFLGWEYEKHIPEKILPDTSITVVKSCSYKRKS